jgi:hypothetical protein
MQEAFYPYNAGHRGEVRAGFGSNWQPNVPATAAEQFDNVGADLDPVDGGDVPENIAGGDIDADAVGGGDGPHDADTVDTSDGCDDCADAGDTADNSIT